MILTKDYSDIKLNRRTRIEGICTADNCDNQFDITLELLLFNDSSLCKTCKRKNTNEKVKLTNMIRFGCVNPFQNMYVKEKIKKSNLEKYGCENPFQNEEVKQSIKRINLEKYGFDYPMQNPEIFNKSSRAMYRVKTYKLPSGKEIKHQGYENYAFNELLKEMNEDDFVNGANNVPSIWYNDIEGKHIDIMLIYLFQVRINVLK